MPCHRKRGLDVYFHYGLLSLLTIAQNFMKLDNHLVHHKPQTIFLFLAPLAVGQRAYVMVCCPSCVRASVRLSIRASVRPCVNFSLNIFFSETAYPILMKFHRNVPAMVPLQNFLKKLIPSKTVVAMATKLKKIENFENLLVRNHKG